jgi:tetratricopeptide (TPR) repeat protein
MDNQADQPNTSASIWKPGQTYAMAAICLVIGLAIGYLVRGSASPTATAAASEVTTAQPKQDPHAGMGQQAMPTLDDMKRMADKQAEPLLAKLKDNPKDAEVLNKTALTYKAAHQFAEAITYFQKALDIDPKNIAVRDDMASCMYFTGNVDGALDELNKSLTYDPKHAGTLMNIGIIKWHGKGDIDGAVASWQKLLKLNPNYPQKAVIEHLIDEATQQRNSAKAIVAPKE